MSEDQGPEAPPVDEDRITPDMILRRADVRIPFNQLHEHGFYLRLGDEEVAGRIRAAHFNRQDLPLDGALWLELSCRSLDGCRLLGVEYVEDQEREAGSRSLWMARLSNAEGGCLQDLDEFQVT